MEDRIRRKQISLKLPNKVFTSDPVLCCDIKPQYTMLYSPSQTLSDENV